MAHYHTADPLDPERYAFITTFAGYQLHLHLHRAHQQRGVFPSHASPSPSHIPACSSAIYMRSSTRRLLTPDLLHARHGGRLINILFTHLLQVLFTHLFQVLSAVNALIFSISQRPGEAEGNSARYYVLCVVGTSSSADNPGRLRRPRNNQIIRNILPRP